MDSILKAKFQPVVHCFLSRGIWFFLIIFLIPEMVIGQCPDHAVTEPGQYGETEIREIFVFDEMNAEWDVSESKINIYNESSGSYLILESDQFPSVGLKENIEFNKTGNRIILSGVSPELDLSSCLLIILNKNCPVKKIEIKYR